MLSFRRKILFSDIVLFLIFICLLFPFVEKTVGRIIHVSIEQQAKDLIVKLRKVESLDKMIEYLRTEESFLFFRVTLFDSNGKLLFDTRLPSNVGLEGETESSAERKEVENAIKYGQAFAEVPSKLFQQSFSYVALSFEAQGREYVLRVGFPLKEIHELTHDIQIGFLTLGALILLMYSVMTWAIMHRLSRPIQQIIDAVQSVQAGKEELLPRIEMTGAIQEGSEFGKLALTLNSLTGRIQKQIESLVAQKNQTEAIIESLGEGVIAVDIDRRVTFANRVACKMLGCERDSLLSQRFSQLKVPQVDLLQKCRELVETALDKSEVVVQTFVMGNQQKAYLDLIAAPLAQHSGIILVLQDKTSDYKIIEMGKDFVANASHELRTPITIIRGFAETLHDLPNLSPEMLKEITEKILRTCIRLDALVKSLLILADIENLSDDRLHPADLLTIGENCTHFLLSAHPHVKLSFHRKTTAATILADGDLIEMAVMNLLENAVKYSPAPAQIDLTISCSDDQAQLIVQDRGIGIPEADLPHIFDRFYTVDKARSRKFGGTGLGLSIVKTIIQKHRGTITVVSRLGEGSTFTLSLPLLT